MLDLGWVNGKRVRPTVYGKTRAEVVDKLAKLRKQQQAGVDLTAPPRTVGEWLVEWLRDFKSKDGTRPATLDRYRSAANHNLVPGLGRIALRKLTARDVQRYLTELSVERSPGTVAKVHAVLRSALSDAVRFDLVERNVAKLVRIPNGQAAERRVPTPKEIRQLLDAATGDRLAEAFVIAVSLGLRRGELLGLKWTDVDLHARVLHVVRAVQRSGGKLRVVEPKTRRSRRRLPLPLAAIQACERQRVMQARERLASGSAWRDEDWVFPSTIGTVLEPRNFSRTFDKLRDQAGLPWLHLHDLRHACGTYLIAQGVGLRTVMEILGHSTYRLTMDTYGHVLPLQMFEAADAMDRALGDER